MALFPRHPVLRVAALLWLLAAAALLTVTLLRPEAAANDRAALASLVPLYFLGLPLAHLGVQGLIRLKVELYLAAQYAPDVFVEALALWTALAVLGYAQWFVLLPWVADRCRRLARRFTGRHGAPG